MQDRRVCGVNEDDAANGRVLRGGRGGLRAGPAPVVRQSHLLLRRYYTRRQFGHPPALQRQQDVCGPAPPQLAQRYAKPICGSRPASKPPNR